jgi:hypothetical protein
MKEKFDILAKAIVVSRRQFAYHERKINDEVFESMRFSSFERAVHLCLMATKVSGRFL